MGETYLKTVFEAFLPFLVTMVQVILPALAAGIAVATERSGKRLNRSRYCLGLALQLVLPYALYSAAVMILMQAYYTLQPAAGDRPWAPMHLFWTLFALRIIVHSVLSFFAARLLVRRLRDAGLNTAIAYLAAIPVLQILPLLAFALHPPSRRSVAATPVGVL